MARKTNASAVETYIDAALAAANDERSRTRVGSRAPVSEEVTLTIVATLRAQLNRWIQMNWGTALLALLPILVIAARTGLSALPRLGISTDGWLPWAVQGIAIAAAAWAGLVTLWQARNSWRRARGFPPVTLRFRRNQYQNLPPLEDIATKLGVAVATLPALVWLAYSGGGEPLWLLLALIALPPVFFLAAIGVVSSLSGLGAQGSVGEAIVRPPVASREVAQLDDRIAQLQQIRVWLKDDKLKSMIDDVIGKQVARSERRQVAYSVAVGVFSLAAGWLLSAISPVSAFAQLLPR